MKSIVLTFGLIAGAILSVMMLATMPFMDRIGYDTGEVIGYTTMVVAFLMVFFGIRSYRENVGNGNLSFGQGFKVGVLITAIASVCYVLTWEIIYFNLSPDFGDKYAAHMIEKERAAGATEAELAAKEVQIAKFRELYQNPLFNAAITLIEVFPIGTLVTAISAGILRRRKEDPQPA